MTVALALTTEESMKSGASLAQIYNDIGSISKVIKPVSKRVERALMRLVTASEVMSQWRTRIEALPGFDKADVIRIQQGWEADEAESSVEVDASSGVESSADDADPER